jgi:uncharacterized membrane-anchored protein YitT (DUF2179 family)
MSLSSKTAAILIGSFLVAMGIDFCLSPIEVLDGGLIGIGLICTYLWGVKTGLTIIVLSIPIFILAWFRHRDYFYSSLHGMFISSFIIDLLQPLDRNFASYVQSFPLVSSITGGLLVGFGIGIMLRYETSTGGADLLAQFLAARFHLNVGVIIFIIDALVISIGGLLFSAQTFFLSGVTIAAVGCLLVCVP